MLPPSWLAFICARGCYVGHGVEEQSTALSSYEPWVLQYQPPRPGMPTGKIVAELLRGNQLHSDWIGGPLHRRGACLLLWAWSKAIRMNLLVSPNVYVVELPSKYVCVLPVDWCCPLLWTEKFVCEEQQLILRFVPGRTAENKWLLSVQPLQGIHIIPLRFREHQRREDRKNLRARGGGL